MHVGKLAAWLTDQIADSLAKLLVVGSGFALHRLHINVLCVLPRSQETALFMGA